MSKEEQAAREWVADNPHVALVLLIKAHEKGCRCTCVIDDIKNQVKAYYHDAFKRINNEPR